MICAINLSVLAAEGIVTPYVYGHSTPSTFIGFAKAFTLELESKLRTLGVEFDEPLLDLNESGVVSLFHHYSEHQKYNYKKTLDEGTILDQPKVDEDITLIFKLHEIDEDYINENGEKILEYAKKLFAKDGLNQDSDPVNIVKVLAIKILERMRFGGGYIKKSNFYICENKDYNKMITWLKPGFFMKKGEKYTSFDELLISTDRNEKGFNTVSLLGYALLEKPIVKDYSRFEKPHSFAEPLLGSVNFSVMYKNDLRSSDDAIFKTGWITKFIDSADTNNGGVILFDMNKQ